MSRRGCCWALVLLAGCSDDGVPQDTDVNATAASGVTSDSGVSGSSGGGNETADSDPTVGTAAPTTTDTTMGEGSTGPDATTGETSGGEEQGAPVLYVAGGNAVSVWSIDEVGALTQVQVLDQGGSTVGPLAHWNSQFLYAARVDQQSVSASTIDPTTGALTELSVTNVGHLPVYLSVAPSGSWLLSADFGADLIQINPINADGTVDGTPSQSSNVLSRPHAIAFDPGGTHVFVPHRDSNLVQQYTFDDTTGTLTPNDPPSVPLPDGAGARHIAFAPDASQAYVVNEFDSTVTAFTYDAANGLLTEGDTVSALPIDFMGDNTGADVHVSRDGAYVYASMRGLDAISVFSTGAGGALTYQSSFATEPRPRAFGLDPFGNFLYAAGQDSGMLASYTIEADGNLTAGAVYDVGANAQWVLGVELPTP